MNIYRSSIMAAVFGAALSAQAVTLRFQTDGEFGENVGTKTISVSEASPAYSTGHDSAFVVTNVSYWLTETNPGSALSLVDGGSGTISGTFNGIAAALNFTVDSGALLKASKKNLRIGNANIVSVTGSGAFAGYTGEGGLSVNLQGIGGLYNGKSQTSFDIEAVPEPASMAALGVGAIGILRRRRK